MQLCFPFGFKKGLQICLKRASADSVSSDLSPLIINSYADQIMHFFAPFFGTKGLTNTYLDENGNEVGFYEESTIWFGACVYCPKCECEIEKKKRVTENTPEGWHDQIKQEAVDAWNRRTKDAE